MTNKEKMESALTGLANTMTSAPSPKPQAVRGRWTGAAIRIGNITRNNQAWNSLPDSPPGATGATSALKTAAGAIEDANYSSAQSVGSALDSVDVAITKVKAVLGI